MLDSNGTKISVTRHGATVQLHQGVSTRSVSCSRWTESDAVRAEGYLLASEGLREAAWAVCSAGADLWRRTEASARFSREFAVVQAELWPEFAARCAAFGRAMAVVGAVASRDATEIRFSIVCAEAGA